MIPKDKKDMQKDAGMAIERFFKDHLCIRTNTEIRNKVPVSNMQRQMLIRLKESYEQESHETKQEGATLG